MESLSDQQARKLVLLSQGIPPPTLYGKAPIHSLNATYAAIKNLGYIQIDTISVIQRAHHHTLWNRNPRYQVSHIEDLLSSKQIFEYWSHAAAYLPMKDYKYSLPRKQSIKNGSLDHWYERDEQLMKSVLKRISKEGPLMARDFENNGKKPGEWNSKPAKRALEYLFMQGALMVPCRKKFQKVYDLAERVLPENTDTSIPDSREYARYLIKRYLVANGLGQASEVGYLLKNSRPVINEAMREMASNGELLRVKLGDAIYYVLPSSLELLNKRLPREKVKILSPFDNLLIQRKRASTLFNFDYQLECYVPEKKRKFGYFVLPVYWDGSLRARMDCKVYRKESTLHILSLFLEPGIRNMDAFLPALSKELLSFMDFNACKNIRIHRTSPSFIRSELEKHLQHPRV